MSKLDVFRHCRFLRHAGVVMVGVVLALLSAVYYAVISSYAYHFSRQTLWRELVSVLVIASFTLLSVLLLWSYLMAAFSNPGDVPPGWHPFSSAQEERAAREEALEGATGASGSAAGARKPNFCRKCQAWKPPRCHHCSVTGRCVLKLDHYCVWISAPVGLLNYKFFLLFLLYSTLACAEATVVMLPVAISILMRDGPASRGASVVLFAAIFCFAFAIALTAFLTMHWDMLAKNYTSIESIDHEVAVSWQFDRGLKRNLTEVFGRRRNWWLLPILGKEDRAWLLTETLDAEVQPLVYNPKMSAAQLV